MTDDYTVINNTDKSRFEIHANNQWAFLEYKLYDGKISLLHTEVPEALSGKGLAGSLATFAFNYAKENNLPVIVYCPFIAAFLKKHPQYQPQVISPKSHN